MLPAFLAFRNCEQDILKPLNGIARPIVALGERHVTGYRELETVARYGRATHGTTLVGVDGLSRVQSMPTVLRRCTITEKTIKKQAVRSI